MSYEAKTNEAKIEQHESPKSMVMTRQELTDLIYKGRGEPQDPRFFPADKGGVFKYFSIENLINIFLKDTDLVYPVVKVGDKIVAICDLQKDHYKENFWDITGVSVDQLFQGNGYATLVLEETFKFAKERGVGLLLSRYSPDGLLKLKSVCQRLSEKYGVEIREAEY